MRKVKRKSRHFGTENVFVLIAIIVFNLLFVIHFLAGIVGAIIGFIGGAFGMIVGGFVGAITSLIYSFVGNTWIAQYVSLGGIHPLAVTFLAIAIFCFGGLWMIGNYYIVKYFIKAMVWYFNLNVRAVKRYEP